jgi:hypothetical protein
VEERVKNTREEGGATQLKDEGTGKDGRGFKD